jgi:dTDP-4-dehydrorhamnose reductase
MGGMYGGDEKDKNFVGKFTRHVLELLKSGVDSYSVGNRVWQPTYTNDLARNSLLLLDHNKEGIWTMACEGEASFFDLANRCISLLGLNDKIEIKRANDHEILHKDIAMRPERICLNNKKLIDSNLSLMRPWEDALKEYLSRPWFDSLYQHCRASHIEPKGVQSG